MTEAAKRRIVLPFAGPIAATDHVLGHELVHAFQYDITDRRRTPAPNSALSLPLWFIEGMAEYLSIGPVDPHTAMWMREATRREKLPDIDQLDDPKYFPYRYGQALWAFVGGKYGDRCRRRPAARRHRAATGYDAAIQGGPRRGLEGAVPGLARRRGRRRYRPIAEATKMPASFARP